MGTVLKAYVEVKDEIGWSRVSKWYFDKDYSLMRALRSVCADDWPLDVRNRDRARYDFTRYWFAAKQSDLDLVQERDESQSPVWTSLVASLAPINHLPVRVLFIEI